MKVVPNCVYVMPPNAIMTVDAGHLRIRKPNPDRRERNPIDLFLASLAVDRGDYAAAIILSGGGGAMGRSALRRSRSTAASRSRKRRMAPSQRTATCPQARSRQALSTTPFPFRTCRRSSQRFDRASRSTLSLTPRTMTPKRMAKICGGLTPRFVSKRAMIFQVIRAHPRSCDSFSGACSNAPEHDADHGEANEGDGFSCVTFVVATKTPVAADPRQGAFNDPALWQHDEAMQVRPLDDIDRPRTRACHDGAHLRSLVAAVANDARNEGKALSGLTQQRFRAVSILNIGGVNIDIQQ
jgi:hypothetical protein